MTEPTREELRALILESIERKHTVVKETKNGAILLDPHNPDDREWYENDEAYGHTFKR